MPRDYSTEVKIKVDRLLEILKANKETHVAEFERAATIYKDRATEALGKRIDELRAGQTLSLTFRLVEPVNYAAEYDTIIGMLELHDDTHIVLSYGEYQQFVENKWAWTGHFAANTQVYLAE